MGTHRVRSYVNMDERGVHVRPLGHGNKAKDSRRGNETKPEDEEEKNKKKGTHDHDHE